MAEQIKDNKKAPDLMQISVEEHEKFNNVITTATLTSSSLEKKISELFGSVFADFEGCKILPVGVPGQPQTLKCKLYFKPCPNKTDDGLYAVKVRGENLQQKRKGASLFDMVNTVNMLSTSKQFDLEDIAKELLAEFLIIPDANVVSRYSPELKKPVNVRLPKNWNNYVEEITDVIANTRFQNPYLVVTLDIVPIVAKMYGKKDDAEVKALAATGATPKNRYQYDVNVIKVLNPTTKSFILEVRRLDLKELNELSQSIGYGQVSGNIVMTRR